MSQVIDLEESRLLVAARRGYRNWSSFFKEDFGVATRLSQSFHALKTYPV